MQMSSSLARIEERVNSMSATVTDVHHTVRGHGEDTGLVSKMDVIIADVKKVEAVIIEISEVRQELKDLKEQHNALKRTVNAHPSYLWLLHNKTKETVSVTIIIIIMALLLLKPFIVGDAQWIVEKVLKFFGL